MFFQQTFNPPLLKILYLFSPDCCKGLFITEILLICSDLARIISTYILLTTLHSKNHKRYYGNPWEPVNGPALELTKFYEVNLRGKVGEIRR
jgi:hypothetical protein